MIVNEFGPDLSFDRPHELAPDSMRVYHTEDGNAGTSATFGNWTIATRPFGSSTDAAYYCQQWMTTGHEPGTHPIDSEGFYAELSRGAVLG